MAVTPLASGAACGRADRRPRPPASVGSGPRTSAPNWSASATRWPPRRIRPDSCVEERRMIDLAKADRSNALVHLKLGFLSLRLGELGGQSHYDDAASEFQWAIDLQPTWPYAWYGMGLAEYGVGDSQISFVTGLKTMLGKDALTRSAMAFAKSAEVDSTLRAGPGGALEHGAAPAGQHQARRGARRAPTLGHDAARRIPRCCSPADGSSARWATATPPWPPSAAISTMAIRPEPGPARDRAHALPARPLRRHAAVLRGRRVGRLRRRSRAIARTSPRSPPTAS